VYSYFAVATERPFRTGVKTRKDGPFQASKPEQDSSSRRPRFDGLRFLLVFRTQRQAALPGDCGFDGPVEEVAEIQCISEVPNMATTMVHVRVDEQIKLRAAKSLAGMGISVSDAVRMLLVRVAAEKALPFEVKVPNAATEKALRAADKGKGKRLKSADAVFKELGI
jgi:DNA-damage-inducible protein J